MNKSHTHTTLSLPQLKDLLFDALVHNQGIYGILKTIHPYLQNTITICNSGYTVIETYPKNTFIDDLDEKNGVLYLPLDNLHSIKEDNLMERIINSDGAFFFYSSHLEYNVIFCPIRIRTSVIGYICIRNTNRAFFEDDLIYTNLLSDFLSVEMQKDDFFAQSMDSQFEYLLCDLLENPPTNEDYFYQRFQQLGYHFRSKLWIIVLSLETIKNSSALNFYKIQLQSIFQNDFVCSFNHHLTLLISKDSQSLFTESEYQKFESFLKCHHCYASISHCCFDISDIRAYYTQALRLLYLPSIQENTKKTGNPFLYYEENLTGSFLSYCKDSSCFIAAIHPDLKMLMAYDKKNNSELFITLKSYLEHNRNALLTSKYLNIHKSTFFYRFNKILDFLQLSLDDYEKLYQYEFSFHILEYLNTDPSIEIKLPEI